MSPLFPACQTISSSEEDVYPLESTELDFLNTFELMADEDTPLLQRDDLEKDQDMTPISCVTSLPTPKHANEEIEDKCVIYGDSTLEEDAQPECPPTPVLKDLSTFDGSGIGDFDDLSIHYEDEDHEQSNGETLMESLARIPSMDSIDNVYNWLERQSYLTDGWDDSSSEVLMRNKRTRSVALSDDVENPRPHPPPQCMLGLTELYPPRHLPPD